MYAMLVAETAGNPIVALSQKRAAMLDEGPDGDDIDSLMLDMPQMTWRR